MNYLGSRFIFRREGKWPFDEFHAMLKSLKFHWDFCFVCGDSWQKLFFFSCKMRVDYCAVHQILVSCRKKIFADNWPKFLRQAHA
jgi:hypothetical protein